MTTTAYTASGATRERPNLPFIIGASSVGTLIEWYDFYLYGVLAVFFSKHFFSPALDPGLAFILSLFVFWTGFLVRPFGAIVFGYLGDLIGRKFTFMLTLLLMIALMTIFAAAILPEITFEIKRDREEEMIHRGAPVGAFGAVTNAIVEASASAGQQLGRYQTAGEHRPIGWPGDRRKCEKSPTAASAAVDHIDGQFGDGPRALDCGAGQLGPMSPCTTRVPTRDRCVRPIGVRTRPPSVVSASAAISNHLRSVKDAS